MTKSLDEKVPRNIDRYKEITICGKNKDGSYVGCIYFAERPFKVSFPQEIIVSMELDIGDKFYWYPQKRNFILPEDCHKEPVKHKPIVITDEMISVRMKKALSYLEKLQNQTTNPEDTSE